MSPFAGMIPYMHPPRAQWLISQCPVVGSMNSVPVLATMR